MSAFKLTKLDNRCECMSNMPESEYPPLEDVLMDWESILGRVWVHLNELTVNPDTMLYFYAALELRFCIESILFELLARLKKNKITNRDLKIYKPKEFAAILRQVDPDFLSKASIDLGFAINKNDLNKIMRLYGQLGRCLHLPKEPFILEDQEEWKNTLEELVGYTYKYLNNLTGHKWHG